jgi:Glutathione S-transferase, N-terminal domain
MATATAAVAATAVTESPEEVLEPVVAAGGFEPTQPRRQPFRLPDELTIGRTKVAEAPTLFVCHGDDGGPRMHPCRRVQEAMRAKGIDYEKVIAAHGNPIPFLRKGSREELRQATGATKLPALKLPDGTVLTHSRAIMAWVDEQP